MVIAHEPSYTTVKVSWAEWVTIMRIRKGWTKEQLSKETGIGRTWLWRALECKPDHERHVELSAEHKERITEALTREEAKVAA